MLAWIQAALPDADIRNFKSDWNSGVALRFQLLYFSAFLINCPHPRFAAPSSTTAARGPALTGETSIQTERRRPEIWEERGEGN